MQHRNDEIFNILTNTLACIKTLSVGSQNQAKKKVYGLVGELEREKGKSLSNMSASDIVNLQDYLSEVIC